MEGVIGFTTMFAGNFAPKNWSFCQGQTINIASNTALYSIIGTMYGGNGTTNFMLPNLQGKKIVGAGNGPGLSPHTVGEVGGSETVTLTLEQMPAHTHVMQINASIKCLNDVGNEGSPEAAWFAANGSGYSATSNVRMLPFNANVTMTTVGSDTPYEILQPYMGINYIICQYGVFPPRG